MLFSSKIQRDNNEPIIQLSGIGKSFRIFNNNRDRLKHFVLKHFGFEWGREFWALNDISLSVKQGETVGIIGVNGSGKSTLLQVVTGILEATKGSVTLNGKVVSLLELGAGFSPEFTGRENIYFNGAILGLTKKEIMEKEDEIIGFSGISEFIDQPVRTYSSGMYVRLAFSVAAHLDAEVLIIDEALSVGDEAFVRKCYKRIDDFKRAGGTTLFVSHSLAAVTEISDRVVLIDHGQVVMEGSPRIVLNFYHKICNVNDMHRQTLCEKMRSGEYKEDNISQNIMNAVQINDYDESLVSETLSTYGDGNVLILEPCIYSQSGTRVNVLKHGKNYTLTYKLIFNKEYQFFRVGMLIKTSSGIELSGYYKDINTNENKKLKNKREYTVSFRFECKLNPGVYFSNIGVMEGITDASSYLARILDAYMFKVISVSTINSTGCVNIVDEVEIK